MRFAIQINTGPCHSHSGYSAYRFIAAALEQGHEIVRVLFYHDGIYHALKSTTPPEDELNLRKLWRKLAAQHHIDLLVCISAAQRRGLLHPDEAARQGKQDNDVAEGFRIGGLGQWVEAVIKADRVLVFG